MPRLIGQTGIVSRARERAFSALRLGALAVGLTWRANPTLNVAILLLMLLQAVVPAIGLLLTKALVDQAALGMQSASLTDSFSLQVGIALVAVILGLGQLVQPVLATAQGLLGDCVTAYMNEQVLLAVNGWNGLARFEDPTLADDLQRVALHGARGGLDLMLHLVGLTTAALEAGSLAFVLAGLHPLVPVLIVAAALPQIGSQHRFGHRTGSHLYAQAPETRRLVYTRDVLLTPESAKDVRLYDLAGFFQEQYRDRFERAVKALTSLRKRLALEVSLAKTLLALVVGCIYLYLVWSTADGSRTPGDLVLFGGAAALLQARLLVLGGGVGDVPTMFGFLPSLARILDSPPDLPLAAAPLRVPRPLQAGIVFDRVTFAYPAHTEPVLHGLSFSVQPGECVALVGYNGAGKTTIVKLLLRLYDPTAGRILLAGSDLREYDVADLRRSMGVIFQDFVRYELTVGENIALGQVEPTVDDDRLVAAAGRAGAGDLLERLPQGLRTPLGRELGGRDLSGGEWQKLALARAFVRDCQLLVLDEPTAALDVRTEHDVYARFHDLTRGKTTILISHRLSAVRMADRILYIQDGRVREEGSHAQLMASGGTYARLYQLQAAQYLDEETTHTAGAGQ